MILAFTIHYHTQWGEKLFIEFQQAGNEQPQAYPMSYQQEGNWTFEMNLSKDQPHLEYAYFIEHHEFGQIKREYGSRILTLYKYPDDRLSIVDHWRETGRIDYAWGTSAFTRVIFRRESIQPKTHIRGRGIHKICFQIHAPQVPKNKILCLVGSEAVLGLWDEKKAVIMSDHNYPIWEAEIRLNGIERKVEYKYALFDPEQKQIIRWEEGENRSLNLDYSSDQMTLVQDENFRDSSSFWRGGGVAIPVFSLRSEKGTGIGEFFDLKLIVDWAVKTGMKLIQILPINDTTANHDWMDSYPYSAISVYALHPMYLNLEKMGRLKDAKLQAVFEEEKKRLNQLDVVDYEAVNQIKSRYFKLLFDQEYESVIQDEAYKQFFNNNKQWLVPYAAFCYLRDKYKSPDFYTWPRYKNYDPQKIASLASSDQKHYPDIAIHYFIQYHLHLQLKEVSDYARGRGVVLKGDIPIGIYRYSADAWVAPELYNMERQAGAPPDDFAVEGQNWGFPTYDWGKMAKDGFKWWKSRLQQMAQYFDAYRIDHILGFFRIWEIPWQSVQGLMGRFNPALPYSLEELLHRGININQERFCTPYIRAHFLEEFLGEFAEAAKTEFLDEVNTGVFVFKPDLDSQRKVHAYIDDKIIDESDKKEYYQQIRDGLIHLLSEVIFFEVEVENGSKAYHPRIAMHFTRSFQELDPGMRAHLDQLYIDYFYRRHEDFWREQAMIKLPAIKSASNMLVCGEDLGMVPATVPGVMNELSILGLEIQRMPKQPDREFVHPQHVPYLSVVSTSSHDMSTIRGWWEENKEKTQRFFNHILGCHGEAPVDCEPWVCLEIIRQHLFSPAMWAIFPLQDLLAINGKIRRENPDEERINIPANPRHYWQYRMHLTLEALLLNEDFNQELQNIISESGRKND